MEVTGKKRRQSGLKNTAATAKLNSVVSDCHSVLNTTVARLVVCVTQILMQQSSSTQSYQYTQDTMTNRQKLESRKANRDLLQVWILIKQHLEEKHDMKLKSSLIYTHMGQVFPLSVWKSCITSNCVLNEITHMISTFLAFLY